MGCTGSKPSTAATTTTATGGKRSPFGGTGKVPDEAALFSRGETDSVFDEVAHDANNNTANIVPPPPIPPRENANVFMEVDVTSGDVRPPAAATQPENVPQEGGEDIAPPLPPPANPEDGEVPPPVPDDELPSQDNQQPVETSDAATNSNGGELVTDSTPTTSPTDDNAVTTTTTTKRIDELNEVVYPDAASCLRAKGLGKYVQALAAQGIVSYHDLGTIVEDPSDPFWSTMPPFPDKKKLLALVALVRGDAPPSTTQAGNGGDEDDDGDEVEGDPYGTPISREKTEHPCDSFELDLHAATFGMCTCGHAKTAHTKDSQSGVGNRFKNLQRTPSATKRDSQGKDSPRAEDEAVATDAPCDNYRIDVKAAGFNICLCGHPKTQHGQRSGNQGKSARDMFKAMEKTSKNPAVMPPAMKVAPVTPSKPVATTAKAAPTTSTTAVPAPVVVAAPPPPPVIVPQHDAWKIITQLDQVLLSTLQQLKNLMQQSNISEFDQEWRSYCHATEIVHIIKDKGVFLLLDEANNDPDTHVAHDFASEHEADLERSTQVTKALDDGSDELTTVFDAWAEHHQNSLDMEREAMEGFVPSSSTDIKTENERFNARVLSAVFEKGDDYLFTWLVGKLQTDYKAMCDVVGGLQSCCTTEQWNHLYSVLQTVIPTEQWERMKKDNVVVVAV